MASRSVQGAIPWTLAEAATERPRRVSFLLSIRPPIPVDSISEAAILSTTRARRCRPKSFRDTREAGLIVDAKTDAATRGWLASAHTLAWDNRYDSKSTLRCTDARNPSGSRACIAKTVF